jgi:hypothetical protein
MDTKKNFHKVRKPFPRPTEKHEGAKKKEAYKRNKKFKNNFEF